MFRCRYPLVQIVDRLKPPTCSQIRKLAQKSTSHAEPTAGIDWGSFGFGLNGVQTDYMWVDTVPYVPSSRKKSPFQTDEKACLVPFQELCLSPAATVFNYGQALFEGLKAFRRQDGSIVIFRPTENAARMHAGAVRFCMEPVPTDVFLKAANAVVRANAAWVPPVGQGALYLRPLLLGTGAGLGVKPSTETTFCIYCSPVGNYFKGDLKAIKLQAVQGYSRAAPGGSGAIKASGNYAPAFAVQKQVRSGGVYDEVLCLDAVTGEGVEEAGASNFFAIFAHNHTIVTPSLDSGTILPGVTRNSICQLAAAECGFTVVEGRLTLHDLREASEAFCCGTGAVITPVSCVSIVRKDQPKEELLVFGDGNVGPWTRKLYTMLTDIQKGTDAKLAAKYKHWIHVVPP